MQGMGDNAEDAVEGLNAANPPTPGNPTKASGVVYEL
jgi:hypothetical protein